MAEPPTLEVQFFADTTSIGSTTLSADDPSMGVGGGAFQPAEGYDKASHANIVDGEYVGDKTASITMRDSKGQAIPVAAIAIEDWFASMGEGRVSVFFETSDQYEALFPGAWELEQEHWRKVKEQRNR